MRKLLFLNRLAFICNLLFLVCLVFQRTQDTIASQDLKGLIIILGWFVSPILNLAANIWYLILLVNKRTIQIAGWLVVTNLIFLLFQIFYHFIL
ncbi:MAG: hypothetical protein K2Q21_00165 [Chitinophagaceae bacterium]|nr:hypothetical protein [Chitinophagaceae bacterium]